MFHTVATKSFVGNERGCFEQMKYVSLDYERVADLILEGWSEQRMPPSKERIIKDLKRNKKTMNEEYEFHEDMGNL